MRLFFFGLLFAVVAVLLPGCSTASMQDRAPKAVGIPWWGLGPFVRPAAARPVIVPNPASTFACPMRQRPVNWEARHTFNPAAAVLAGQVHLLYRAEDDSGNGIGSFTSRLGLARSRDGLSFSRLDHPVFYPDDDLNRKFEWDGGTEDPRIARRADGVYVMTYTCWDRKCARLGIASSRDLVAWTKQGSAFGKTKWNNRWAKSGSIVCRLQGDQLVAVKINGHYWMYWGESPIFAATSEDLMAWTPVEDGAGNLLPILKPRAGCFDSTLTEPGPPAVLTRHGIVFLYNGKNGADGDAGIGRNAYSSGQALMAAADPVRVLDRPTVPFFKPELPFEKSGQYVAGTTFIEGLVHFKGKWFLYYGCADTFVGVAIAPAN
jgi:predicted GH43/DUF377 family glycosyl hydrolase